MTLPVVDLAPWRDGTDTEKVRTAVDEAPRTRGCFQLVGHAVPESALAEARAQAERFFGLSPAAKARYAAGRAGRGWRAAGDGSPVPVDAPTVPRDCTESYVVGAPAPPRWRSDAESHWFPENVWPAETPGLQPALEDCAMRLRLVSDELLRVCAQAIGLPSAHFVAHTAHPAFTVQLHRFTGGPTTPVDGKAHTQPGTLTLLDTVASPLRLHVRDDQDGWHEVPPPVGALLALAGDMLEHWSGRRWRATAHRLAPSATAQATGVAVEYAHNADIDAVLTPVPGTAPDLRPTPTGQFLRRR